MPTPRARLGEWGEGVASQFLQERGYRITETNYRCRWGEVDIVARDGDELVFVEVRTRRDTEYGTPEESITAAKARRLVATAQEYMQRHGGEDLDWRIDLVSIRLGRGHQLRDISHLTNVVEL